MPRFMPRGSATPVDDFTENRIECNAPTSTTGKQGPGLGERLGRRFQSFHIKRGHTIKYRFGAAPSALISSSRIDSPALPLASPHGCAGEGRECGFLYGKPHTVQCADQHHGEARSGLGSRLASGPYGPASFGPNASAFHDPYPLLQPPRTRHAQRIPIQPYRQHHRRVI